MLDEKQSCRGKKSPQIETIRIFVSFLELWEGCGMWRRDLSLVKVGKHWCCGGAVVCSVHGQGDEGWNPSPHGTAATYRLLLFQIHTKVLSMTMGAWRQSTLCEFKDKNKAHWLSGLKLKCLFEEGRHGSVDMGRHGVRCPDVLMDPDIAHSLYCSVRLRADQLLRIHRSYPSQKPRTHSWQLPLPSFSVSDPIPDFWNFSYVFLSLSPPTAWFQAPMLASL